MNDMEILSYKMVNCAKGFNMSLILDYISVPCDACGAEVGEICRPHCIGSIKYYEVDTLSD